ncbi:MAG: hypothetical protein GY869_13060 [Planctomycetes bacterium]|nr:hypothetical protein [Planctomycetota bacterium]
MMQAPSHFVGVLAFWDFGEIINNSREFACKNGINADNNFMISVKDHVVGGDLSVASRLSHGILRSNQVFLLNGLLLSLGLLALLG